MKQIWCACLIVGLVFFIVGCGQEKRVKIDREKTFDYAVQDDTHPVVGCVYELESGTFTQVTSTCEKDVYYLGEERFFHVAVAIISSHDYCDGESLRKGLYKFVGNRQYVVRTPVEVNENVRMIEKKVKCRTFIELGGSEGDFSDAPTAHSKQDVKKRGRHMKDSYL